METVRVCVCVLYNFVNETPKRERTFFYPDNEKQKKKKRFNSSPRTRLFLMFLGFFFFAH